MNPEAVSRHQFLRQLGLNGAALMAVYCGLTACENEKAVTPQTTTPVGTGLVIDLTATVNAALLKNGGYVIVNNVVVARTAAGTYIAVTVVCSHEGLKQVVFQNNEFYCTGHGARYDLTGKGLNNDGRKGLTSYKTELTGTTLRILV